MSRTYSYDQSVLLRGGSAIEKASECIGTLGNHLDSVINYRIAYKESPVINKKIDDWLADMVRDSFARAIRCLLDYEFHFCRMRIYRSIGWRVQKNNIVAFCIDSAYVAAIIIFSIHCEQSLVIVQM